MDGMSGGYALGMLGVLVLISGLVTVAIYRPRVRRLEQLLAGQGTLAHWVYDPPTVERQVERDRSAQLGRNRWLLRVVLIWLVVWTAVFVATDLVSGDGDGLPVFLAMMAGIGLILTAAALGLPRLYARQALRSSREVYIGTHGVYINGAYHSWAAPLARLDSVALVDGWPDLFIRFRMQHRVAMGQYQTESVQVPVPPGQEDAARRVVAVLDSQVRRG